MELDDVKMAPLHVAFGGGTFSLDFFPVCKCEYALL